MASQPAPGDAQLSGSARDWVSWAVEQVEADAHRSADTHLIGLHDAPPVTLDGGERVVAGHEHDRSDLVRLRPLHRLEISHVDVATSHWFSCRS